MTSRTARKDLSEFFIDAVPSVKNLGIVYNPKSKRFTDPNTGRFLSQNKTLSIIEEGIEQRTQNLQKLAEGLAQGRIEIDKFAVLVANDVKSINIYHAAIAKGGRLDLLTKNELAALNNRLKKQLTTAKGFENEKYGIMELVRDIVKGDVSEAQLKNRLTMYAESGYQVRQIIGLEAKKNEGYKQALRIMIGDHRTCEECKQLAFIGWVSIESVVMPGDRCSCRSRCRCILKYK
jgi:hypothetical protein